MATYAAYRHIELDKVGAGKKRTSKKNASAASSSDSESDEDYVPSSKDLKDAGKLSADEKSDDTEYENETENVDESGKRRRNSGRKKKKAKLIERDEDDEQEEEEEEREKVDEKKIEEIWKEFKNEQPVVAKVTETAERVEAKVDEVDTSEGKPKTKTIKELFEFAGETVQVEKEVPVDTPVPVNVPTTSAPRRGGGLSSVLGQIGKKNKLSVLEKSKLDWNTFKKEEGISEQLETHNKGKDGFLERQDFLQRTDLRRFEIEKAMRNSSRRFK